jgi:hypothetical protein
MIKKISILDPPPALRRERARSATGLASAKVAQRLPEPLPLAFRDVWCM